MANTLYELLKAIEENRPQILTEKIYSNGANGISVKTKDVRTEITSVTVSNPGMYLAFGSGLARNSGTAATDCLCQFKIFGLNEGTTDFESSVTVYAFSRIILPLGQQASCYAFVNVKANAKIAMTAMLSENMETVTVDGQIFAVRLGDNAKDVFINQSVSKMEIDDNKIAEIKDLQK